MSQFPSLLPAGTRPAGSDPVDRNSLSRLKPSAVPEKFSTRGMTSAHCVDVSHG